MNGVDTSELKPCPFCGGESHYSEYWPHWDTKEHAVWCFAECGGRVTAPTKTKAIAAWNTRAPDLQTTPESGQESMRAEIERLRERLIDVTAHLVAAVSLLESGGRAAKKAAPSDRMFDQMVKDYKASINRARQALGEHNRTRLGEE